MAQKKGLIHRFIVGKDRDENYARSTLPSTRWELLWDIIKGRFWKLVLINLMLLIAVLPALFILYISVVSSFEYASALPFSGSMFTGYPFIPDLHQLMYLFEFKMQLQTFLWLIPCMLFSSIIMSGIFYIARNLAWSEGVFIANDFWKGLKQNIKHFLLITLLLSIVIFISSINIFILNNSMGEQNFFTSPVVSTIMRAFVYVSSGFIIIMAFFAYTITVNYKLKFFQLIKNSFYLTLGLLPRNIVVFALCFAPFLLFAILGIQSPISQLFLGIILLLGFSVAVVGWTIYSHWVFDKFINDRVEGAVKNKGIYPKMDKQGRPIEKTYFKNPKKKKPVKPVTDEEITITELPLNYSRGDLEKLRKEKDYIKKEGEEWAQRHKKEYEDSFEEENGDDDILKEEDYYEGYEDAMRLEGYESEIEEEVKEAEKQKLDGDNGGK